MPRKLKRKSKVLRGRNVKKRVGARAQSKQIMALSRSVSSITRKQFANVHTVWQRNMLSVETVSGGVNAYICPIPYAPGNPVGASQSGGPVQWTDNLSIASQASYQKKAIFGVAREAGTSNEIYHTGGVIKWQFITNEPAFSKYYVFLIKPKKAYADQLTIDRRLKGAIALNPTLGSAAELTRDLDYVVHDEGLTGGTVFGAQMNPKYWTTLYQKEITSGNVPQPVPTTSNNSNFNMPGSAALTALTARGTIKLPAGGMLKNVAVGSQTGAALPDRLLHGKLAMVTRKTIAGAFLWSLTTDFRSMVKQASLAS